MQKKLIALAVAGLASTAAFAQTNVTIYGVADVGVEWANTDSAGDAGTKFRVQSGQQSGSRLGFRGEEALGNGLKAIFTLEMGLTLDNGQNTAHATPGGNNQNEANVGGFGGSQIFQRQAFAGLSHAKYGTATIGRQYTPFYLTKLDGDAFALGMGGTVNNLMGIVPGNADRINNSIVYASPTFAGFSGQVAYSTGDERNLNTKLEDSAKVFAARGAYNNGPFAASLSYHDVDATALVNNNLPSSKAWLAGANYDFKIVKLFGSYGQGKTDLSGATDTKGRLWSLGVSVPFGAHTVLAQYTDADNKTSGVKNGDASLWSIGYTYSMSKRTNLYANYSKLSNDRNVGFDINSAISNGLNAANGSDPTSFMAGVRHTF